MRKSILKSIITAIVLVAIVGLAFGCAKPAPAPTPTPTPTPTPAPTPTPTHEEVTITMATYLPPSYVDFGALWEFVDRVNEKGKGVVHIDFYDSGKLLKAKTLIPGLMDGTVDAACQTTSYFGEKYPTLIGETLPFMWKDAVEYNSYVGTLDKPLLKLINKELAKKNLFKPCTYALPVEHIWTLKPMRTPADMKGLRLRTAGPAEIKTCEAFGAGAVAMPSAEAYMALQRGTVDGVYCYAGTVGARKLDELVKYVNMATFGAYGHEPYFRLDYWNKLPKDVKDILLKEFKWLGENGTNYAIKVHNEQYWPRFEKAGVVKIEPTPEELAAFRTAANSVYDWWKGLVGEDIYNEYMKLAGK